MHIHTTCNTWTTHATNTETTASTALHFFLSYFKQSCPLGLHGPFSVFSSAYGKFFLFSVWFETKIATGSTRPHLLPSRCCFQKKTTFVTRHNIIGDLGTERFAPVPTKFSSLTHLDLTYDNHIGSAGTKILVSVLPPCPVLSDLRLHRNQIGPEEANSLAEVIV